MEWREFTQRLTRELTHLPDNAFLVVQAPGGFPYAQAMRSPDGLSAEVVSNEFLPPPLRLADDQERLLRQLDWQDPGQEGHVNWWQQVTLPPDSEDLEPQEAMSCGRLAASMAAALHRVFRIPVPLDLEYRANRNGPDGGPLDLPYLGLNPVARPPADSAAAEPTPPQSPPESPAEPAVNIAGPPSGHPSASLPAAGPEPTSSGLPRRVPGTSRHPGQRRPVPEDDNTAPFQTVGTPDTQEPAAASWIEIAAAQRRGRPTTPPPAASGTGAPAAYLDAPPAHRPTDPSASVFDRPDLTPGGYTPADHPEPTPGGRPDSYAPPDFPEPAPGIFGPPADHHDATPGGPGATETTPGAYDPDAPRYGLPDDHDGAPSGGYGQPDYTGGMPGAYGDPTSGTYGAADHPELPRYGLPDDGRNTASGGYGQPGDRPRPYGRPGAALGNVFDTSGDRHDEPSGGFGPADYPQTPGYGMPGDRRDAGSGGFGPADYAEDTPGAYGDRDDPTSSAYGAADYPETPGYGMPGDRRSAASGGFGPSDTAGGAPGGYGDRDDLTSGGYGGAGYPEAAGYGVPGDRPGAGGRDGMAAGGYGAAGFSEAGAGGFGDERGDFAGPAPGFGEGDFVAPPPSPVDQTVGPTVDIAGPPSQRPAASLPADRLVAGRRSGSERDRGADDTTPQQVEQEGAPERPAHSRLHYAPTHARGVLVKDQPPITDPVEVERIARYLRRGAGVLRGGTAVDEVEPERGPVVPMVYLTDGVWVWSAAQRYYLERYGIPPHPAFYEHIVANGYQVPEASDDLLVEAAEVAKGALPPAPLPQVVDPAPWLRVVNSWPGEAEVRLTGPGATPAQPNAMLTGQDRAPTHADPDHAAYSPEPDPAPRRPARRPRLGRSDHRHGATPSQSPPDLIADQAPPADPGYGGTDQTYGTDPNYSGTDQAYGADPSHGPADRTYGGTPGPGDADPAYSADLGYGAADPAYGSDPGYGAADPAYGADTGYGAADRTYGGSPGHGAAEQTYGGDPGYGAADPAFGGTSGYSSDPGYSGVDPAYGGTLGGGNDQPYGRGPGYRRDEAHRTDPAYGRPDETYGAEPTYGRPDVYGANPTYGTTDEAQGYGSADETRGTDPGLGQTDQAQGFGLGSSRADQARGTDPGGTDRAHGAGRGRGERGLGDDPEGAELAQSGAPDAQAGAGFGGYGPFGEHGGAGSSAASMAGGAGHADPAGSAEAETGYGTDSYGEDRGALGGGGDRAGRAGSRGAARGDLGRKGQAERGGLFGPRPRTAEEAELEEALGAARERGDHREYFRLIRVGDLVLPSTGDPSDRQYATADFHDGTYVLAYTSPAAMAEALRDEGLHHRRLHFQELAAEWPKAEWRLAINAGLTTAAFADPESIERLGREDVQPEVVQEAVEEAPPEPEPAPEPVAEELPAPAVMQKVVPPEHVMHYLQHAYDQVAGYVHRARDVHGLNTPEQLVRALGLSYRGSPFAATDQVIHVLRWTSVKSSLLRTPFGGLDEQTMRSHPEGWVIERPPFGGDGFAVSQEHRIPEFKVDSQKLPHGAELYRLDDTGERTLVAVYDADKRRWRRSRA